MIVVPGVLFDQCDCESILEMRHQSIVTAVCMLAVFPLMTHAETHLVTVQTSFFAPNNIVIQAGDTLGKIADQMYGDG